MALTFQEAAKRYESAFPSKQLVQFTGVKKPCVILCPTHGEQQSSFFMGLLRSKHGCPACGSNAALKALSDRSSANDKLDKIQSLSSDTSLSDSDFRQQVIDLLNN